MCHCFDSPEDLTESEREEVIEEHSDEELRDEYDESELEALGVEA